MPAYSTFLDKAHEPTESEVFEALGAAAERWRELRKLAALELGGVSEEWTYSGKNHGWALRLKQDKRAILYLTPSIGQFRASFALGEKAVAQTQSAGLPAAVLDLIAHAPKYPEGTAARLVVEDDETMQAVLSLVRIKLAS